VAEGSRGEARSRVAAAARSREVAGVRRIPEEARSRAAAALGVVHTPAAVRAEGRSRVVAGSRPDWGYPRTVRLGCQGAPEGGSWPLLPRRWELSGRALSRT
jgi:hypothetical protein